MIRLDACHNQQVQKTVKMTQQQVVETMSAIKQQQAHSPIKPMYILNNQIQQQLSMQNRV